MAAVHCASRKVKQVYDKADELAITYESIKDKSEIEVEEMFGNKKEVNYYYERPNYEYIHNELLKPGVTVMLLWEEYVENPDFRYFAHLMQSSGNRDFIS